MRWVYKRIPKEPAPTPRGHILTTAKSLTEGARNATYGSPFENMAAYADLIEGYLQSRGIIEPSKNGVITAVDACRFMQMAKWARVRPGLPYHEDNFVDDCAYGAMAGECAQQEED